MAAQSVAWRGPWAGPWPGARRATAALWARAAGPAVPASALGSALGAGEGWRLEGPLALCPATGALLAGGRAVDPGWDVAGPPDRAGLRWGSPAAEAGLAPLGFALPATAEAVTGALLPALAALDRLGVPMDWAAVIPARIGAVFELQEVLAAGAAAPRPVRVVGWSRALRTERAAWLAPGAVQAQDRAEAAARLARALRGSDARRAAPRLAALVDAAEGRPE